MLFITLPIRGRNRLRVGFGKYVVAPAWHAAWHCKAYSSYVVAYCGYRTQRVDQHLRVAIDLVEFRFKRQARLRGVPRPEITGDGERMRVAETRPERNQFSF